MPISSMSVWEQGAQALALIKAALERGYLDFLAVSRSRAEVDEFAGHPAADLLAAFEAHGLVVRDGQRFRLDTGIAAGLAADAPIGLAARILRADLLARQVADVVRTGKAPLSGDESVIVALSVALQPGEPSRAIVDKLHSAIPEVRDAIATGRMLDVGSGVGGYVLTALSLLPGMRATTLELIPEVAAVARQRAHELGVADRADIRVMDARDFQAEGEFDSAFWAQPFFPEPTRAATLAMIRRSLRPGGTLVVQQLDDEPDGFSPARLVARSAGLPYARPLAALVAEAEAAGFDLIRTVEIDLGRLALLQRP
jgi:SAM-dependent methyltransferase